MWAILRVWALINIPDNVITADTGTGGDTRVRVRFTLSRSPGSRIWVWSISRGPGATKPRHQNLQTALIWEHCEGSLLGLLILSPDSSNPGNTTFMWAEANETSGDAAHWYPDQIVRRRQTRTETIQIEISKPKSSLPEICLSLRMTTS